MQFKKSKIWNYASTKKRRLLSRVAPVYETKRLFSSVLKYDLDLVRPKTLNEKIQYLKLNDYRNNSIVTQCVDKYRVRNYIKEKGLDYLLPELYLCCKRVKEIDFDILPQSFALKCNHGCGYNVLCKNKEQMDFNEVSHLLKTWLKEDYWTEYCEIQYKFVDKRIIVEEYLGEELQTYKFYCFNGTPKVFYISSNGPKGEKDLYLDYYDMDFNHLDIKLANHLSSPRVKEIVKPYCFEEMKRIAEILSESFPFVRVDLYDVSGKVYFSELTFIPTGGFMCFDPVTTDKEWGEWLRINSVFNA